MLAKNIIYRLTAVLFAILAAAAPVSAGELSPEELGRAARFAQRVEIFYLDGRTLGLEMRDAAGYIDSYHAGDIELEEFSAVLDPFLEDMRAPIDDYRARYPRAPMPPSVGSREHVNRLAAFAKMVVGLGEHLDRQLGILHRLRDAALTADEDAYEVATADLMALSAAMILAENLWHEGMQATLAPENPRRGLLGAIIGGNEARAVALGIIEAGYRGDEFDAGKYALNVETALRGAGRAIVESEKAARRMLNDLEGKFAKSEEDRYTARFTGESVQAYERALVIERAILETERGLLDYLRAVNAGNEDADIAVETMYEFQAELEEQIQQRLRERNIRREMADEFARSLEALRN